jgi:SAM-dependent methyltransferase
VRFVGAAEVFEHCQASELVISESHRVVKPGGLLCFTVPFLWPLHDVPHEHYRYTPPSLERHLKNAGCTNVCFEAVGGWDKSVAQMIELWVRRRSISSGNRAFLSILAYQ